MNDTSEKSYRRVQKESTDGKIEEDTEKRKDESL
jgi:hypothetical protein